VSFPLDCRFRHIFPVRRHPGRSSVSVATAAGTAAARLLALSDLEATARSLRLLPCGAVRVRLVDWVLLISDANAAAVIAQVIHPAVDVVVDHLRRLEEGLLDVEARLRRGLQEYQSVFLSKALAFLGADLPAIVQVSFIADQHHHYVRVAVLADFLEPPRQVIERFLPRYVVYEQGASGSTVVAAGDRLEGLLTSRVPDLELDLLVIDFDGARPELDTDSQVVLLAKTLVRELEEQA
jgi:hypothetical protein